MESSEQDHGVCVWSMVHSIKLRVQVMSLAPFRIPLLQAIPVMLRGQL